MLSGSKNPEIVKIIHSIALEKRLDVAKLFLITKNALLEALTGIYGKAKLDLDIDPNSGEITIRQCYKIVADEDCQDGRHLIYENEEDGHIQNDEYAHTGSNYDIEGNKEYSKQHNTGFHYSAMKLSDALKINKEATVDGIIKITLRNAWDTIEKSNKTLIKTFSRVFFMGVEALTQEQDYLFFSKRENMIMTGVVKKFTRDGYILLCDSNEILLPAQIINKAIDPKKIQKSSLRAEIIPGEFFTLEERVQIFIIQNPKVKDGKYRMIASRIHPGFIGELMKQNIPEVREGQILIKAIERAPGIRAKVAVHSTDINNEPIGACVGVKGIRILPISKELRGERIDIINHSDDLVTYITNIMHPIKPLRVTIDEENNKIIITVHDNDIAMAVGKGGMNVRFVSKLISWPIEMISESDEKNQKLNEIKRISEEFILALDVEEIIAQLLIMAGYKTINAIALTSAEALSTIEYFDMELAEEIKSRAINYLVEEKEKKLSKLDNEFIQFIKTYIADEEFLIRLSDSEIYNIANFADLDIDEVIAKTNNYQVNGEDISEEKIDEMILKAREIYGLISPAVN